MKRLSELMSLKGRTALITGGAGHIGRAMAEALAELDCNLCLLDRSEDRMRAVADEVQRQWNVRIECLQVDIEVEQERARLPGMLQARSGRLDILVNCASFVGDTNLEGWSVPFAEQKLDAWRRALEVNLTSVFHLCQILAPMLRANGTGSIVNVSSIYGVVGPDLRLYEGTSMGNPAAYAASKRRHGSAQPLALHGSGAGDPGQQHQSRWSSPEPAAGIRGPLRGADAFSAHGNRGGFQGSDRVLCKRSFQIRYRRESHGRWRVDRLVTIELGSKRKLKWTIRNVASR